MALTVANGLFFVSSCSHRLHCTFN